MGTLLTVAATVPHGLRSLARAGHSSKIQNCSEAADDAEAEAKPGTLATPMLACCKTLYARYAGPVSRFERLYRDCSELGQHETRYGH